MCKRRRGVPKVTQQASVQRQQVELEVQKVQKARLVQQQLDAGSTGARGDGVAAKASKASAEKEFVGAARPQKADKEDVDEEVSKRPTRDFVVGGLPQKPNKEDVDERLLRRRLVEAQAMAADHSFEAVQAEIALKATARDRLKCGRLWLSPTRGMLA